MLDNSSLKGTLNDFEKQHLFICLVFYSCIHNGQNRNLENIYRNNINVTKSMKIHIKHYKENISINQLYLRIAIHRKHNTKINKQQFRIPAQHHYSNWTGAKRS